MTSEKKIVANRLNAKKGGVKTEKGKAIVSKNAIKHGLTAQSFTHKEDQKNYALILEELKLDLQPDGLLEVMLCERIAFHYVKLLKIAKMESIYMQLGSVQAKIEQEVELQNQFSGNLKDIMLNTIDIHPYEKAITHSKDQVNGLRQRFYFIQNDSFSLTLFEGLEKIQKYDTNTENRLLKLMKEYQNLKEMKRSKIV